MHTLVFVIFSACLLLCVILLAFTQIIIATAADNNAPKKHREMAKRMIEDHGGIDKVNNDYGWIFIFALLFFLLCLVTEILAKGSGGLI